MLLEMMMTTTMTTVRDLSGLAGMHILLGSLLCRANDAHRSDHQSYFHYVDPSCSTLTSRPAGHCYYSEMRDAFRARARTNVSRVTQCVCAEILAYRR